MGAERLCGARRGLSSLLRVFRVLRVEHHVPKGAFAAPRGPGAAGSSGLQAARRGLCSLPRPPADVTLFQHDRSGFFRLLGVFCGGQLVFWTYLAHFAFTGLRDTSGAADSEAGGKRKPPGPGGAAGAAGPWGLDVNLGSGAWRWGFTLACLAVAAAIPGLGLVFCRRSVSRVVLHRGGRTVTVETQSPLGAGRGRSITVPLSEVACYAHRQEAPSFIPLRVKGHKFYFLLDKDGTVTNAKLFDVTVGAYRQL